MTPRCGFRIGFQVLDCGFPVGWNLPVFPELNYRSQCPGLQIPRAKISRILKARLPYMGRNMGKFSVPFFPAFLDLVENREKLGRVLIVVKPALYSNLSSETTVEREFDIIVFIRG